jgi:hypothetical protein
MFYRNTNNDKHNNIRIVTLAAGLALATVAIGGNAILKENSKSASVVTPRVERIAPQFGSMADAAYASHQISAPAQFGTMADAVQATQASAQTSPAVNVGEYLGIGQPAAGQSFATMADAVIASEGLRPQTSPAVNTGEYLGLGQPAAGSGAPQFATMADAAYASR